MKQAYKAMRLQERSLAVIRQANKILAEYSDKGLRVTLRQLYYQFVQRNLLANNQKNYKRLGSIINDGRLCGLVSWDMIEDRTRSLNSISVWDSPAEIIAAVSRAFKLDLWANQPCRVEVWVEKEALSGVIESICQPLRVPSLACRGYASQSLAYESAQRFIGYNRAGQDVVILHLGDHDPSGIDMTRDNTERLEMFGARVDFRRIALNMDQIELYQPPPNPAKETDIRFKSYQAIHGDESWELDALGPDTLRDLIVDQVDSVRDAAIWADDEETEREKRKLLKRCYANWETIENMLKNQKRFNKD